MNTVLANGGSKPFMETFKEFRGREPNPDALLESLGLLDKNTSIKDGLAKGAKTVGNAAGKAVGAVGKVLHKCIIPLTVLAFAIDYF